MKIFVYGYDVREENIQYIDTLFECLEQHKLEVKIYTKFKEAYEETASKAISYPTIKDYQELKTEHPDAVLTLGGDGTILNAATIVKDIDTCILGINLGRLGFLASTEKKDIKEAIQLLAERKFNTQRRTLLQLSSKPEIFTDSPIALNDFTLHKRDTSSMVTIHTFVNGSFLNSYWADGIIVATPTGSTGYSLSCGGPIITPDSKNFVITPVAPHNLNVRPVIIPDDSEISFKIEGRSENFLCTLDSRYNTVSAEHEIAIRKCNFDIKLVELKGQAFYQTIREKLSWGKDARNYEGDKRK